MKKIYQTIIYKISLFASVILLLIVTTGCAIKMGGTNTHSAYVYPNSNITPLGQTNAYFKKTSFFIPPIIDGKVIRKLEDNAAAKYPDADMLIDYTVDTKFTTILFFYILEINLKGTAANMVVGKQDIGQTKD